VEQGLEVELGRLQGKPSSLQSNGEKARVVVTRRGYRQGERSEGCAPTRTVVAASAVQVLERGCFGIGTRGGEARNSVNPMVGCRAQQTCNCSRGENRRSREERQGRNVSEVWQLQAEGAPRCDSSQQPSSDGGVLGVDARSGMSTEGIFGNPKRVVWNRTRRRPARVRNADGEGPHALECIFDREAKVMRAGPRGRFGDCDAHPEGSPSEASVGVKPIAKAKEGE